MLPRNACKTRLPALFIGHGSPMNAIENNHYTELWKTLGQRIITPRAILMISAHWMTSGDISLTAMINPSTIHDFGGFPQELFNVQYPAPGSPEVANQLQHLLTPLHPTLKIKLDYQEWGLDHGAWSILKHMYPDANIPVIQMSLNSMLTTQQHFQVAQSLQSLRDDGILIIGSGNIVHNLSEFRMSRSSTPAPAFSWSTNFGEYFKSHLLSYDFQPLINFEKEYTFPDDPGAQLAVPPPAEHYIPALYTLGAFIKNDVDDGKNAEEKIEILIEGIEFASISMFSFAIGL